MKINKEIVKRYFIADILYNLHKAQEEIKFFEKKYKTTLKDFEKEIQNSEENFEKWDDYLEWKAAFKYYQELQTQLKDLENADIKVS
jgi:hypothetical protein